MPSSNPQGGKQVELHGCERLVFSGWDEEVSYLERVNFPDRDEAAEYIGNEVAVDAEDLDPQAIFMRWEVAPPDEPFEDLDGYEFDGGWLECEPDHPDAVPFWKDTP